MKYVLIIKPSGTKVRYPATTGSVIPTKPGDEILLVDEDGKPVEADLRAEEDDLTVNFEDGVSVSLKDFYLLQGEDDPVTIGIKPSSQSSEAYEFNSQVGNLPGYGGFSLMRFSNVAGVGIEDPVASEIGNLSIAFGASSGFVSPAPESTFESTTINTVVAAPGPGRVLAGDPFAGGAMADQVVTTENSATVIDLLANDTAPNGGPLLIVAIQGLPVEEGDEVTISSGGKITLMASGKVMFAPGADSNGLGEGEEAVDTFFYSIVDLDGNVTSSTVAVTISGENDGPVAGNDFALGLEDQPIFSIPVLANDVDAEGDSLSIVGTPTALHGVVQVNPDGSLNYVPNLNFFGDDTITYVVTDGNGASDTATVNVTVDAVNDAPDAAGDTGAGDEDGTITGNVIANDSDVDGDTPLTVIRNTQPSHGTLVIAANGDFTYTPDENYNGPDSFTYTVEDPSGASDIATVNLTVNPVNDVPVANPMGGTPGVDPGVYDDTDTVAEDAVVAITGDVLANDSDPDGDVLMVSEVNGVAANVDSLLMGTYGTFRLRSDGTYSYELDNMNAEVQALGVDESTVEVFTYTADDGNGGSAEATLRITITGTNDVPVANPMGGTPGVDFGVYDDVNSVEEDSSAAISGNVISNDRDPDGDTLVVSAVNGSAGNVGGEFEGTYGTITVRSDGSYSYELDNSNPAVQGLAAGAEVTEVFSYTASDGNGGAAIANLSITITGSNDAPVAVADIGTGNEDATITGNVITNDTDVDGDTPLTVKSNTDPANGTLVIAANGDYTYTPNANFNGSDSFTYVVEDPSGATGTATVTLNVSGVSDAPIAVDDVATIDEDTTLLSLDVLGNDSDPDGDPLAIQGMPTALHGSVSVNMDGTLNYTPDANFNGTDTITYVVEDGTGASDSASVTVTVNAVNDAPEAVADSGSGNEDATITGNVITNDIDVDGDSPLTVLSNTTPENGTLVIAANGSYTYTPDANFNGTDSFTYVVEDPSGATDTATVSLTVSAIGDAPMGVDDVATVDEDEKIFNLDVLGNDVDPDGDPLAIQGTPTALNGEVSVNMNGTLNYTPDANFNGTDTITYIVEDGTGASDTATVTVTVNAVNDAPDAVADNDSGNEDATITGNVITNDTDVDGDSPLTVLSSTNPANGSLVIAANGSYTYTPDANFNGTDSFTYVVQDPAGATDTATVTLTVSAIGDAPMGVDDVVTTDEDATIFNLDVLGNDTDPDGDSLAIQGTPTATNGTVSVNIDGTLNYAPDANFNGTDTITYIVEDGTGASDSASVTVTVNAVNDAPDAVDDSGSGNEDATISGNVITNDTDVDGDSPLTVLSNTTPANGALVIAANGSYTYTPDANFNGTDSFTYVVQDPSGATDTATVTLTVSAIGDAPMGVDDVATVDEDGTIFNLNVLGNDTDPDGDALAIQGTPTAANGMVSVNMDGTLNYTPDANFNGTDMITYIVEDGTGASDAATVTVTVNAVNDAPDAVDDSASGNKNTAITGNVIANDTDVDGDSPLTVLSNTDPANGTLMIAANGEFTYTPDMDYSGPDSFTYVVQDPSGVTDTATVTLTVSNADGAPVGVDDVASVDEDTVLMNLDVLGNDTDPDGDMLAIQGTPTAANGMVSVNMDGTLDYTPDADFNGTDTITYIVEDGTGASDTATVTVTVNAVNDAPDAVDDSGIGNEDATITGNVIANDSDVDGDSPLTVRSNTDPANGTLVIAANGDYTYTPNANFSGTDSFTYVLEDPSGLTDTATVTLTVNALNDAPMGVDDTASVDEDTVLMNLDVLGNDTDPDGDMLAIQGTPTAVNGMVSVNMDGTLDYTPDADFNGTDTITYIVEDGNGASDTATVTVTVNAVNDAPEAADDSGIGNEDATITGNVISNDSDVDGDSPLTVRSNTDPANGTLVIAANGDYTYTPNANFSGTDSFTYVLEDPSGLTDTATVTLTVGAVNDAPIGVDDVASVDEDTVLMNLDVLGNDTDPDGDTLAIQGTPTAANGMVSVNMDGTLDYTPDADFNGTDTITYIVEDGSGASDTATVTVTVNAVNDAPEAADDSGTGNEDGTITGNVISNDSDVDGDSPLTVVSNTDPSNGTLVIAANGAYTYTPNANFNGTDSFTYVVQDPNGLTDTATVTLTVGAVNDAPIGVDDVASVDEDTVLMNLDVLGNDTDPDGDTLAIQGTPTAANGMVSVNMDGTLEYTPNADFSGTDTITYIVEDGTGASDTATVTVTVNAVNDAPEAADDSGTGNEDATITGNVISNDSDVDGDSPLTVMSNTDPANGTLVIAANGDYTYTPNANFNGIDSFTYVVQDPDGLTDTATVTLTVSAVNDAPVGVDDVAMVDEDIALINIDVLGNDTDPDGDPLSIKGVPTAVNGMVSVNMDGTLNYTPNLNFNGTDTITYIVEDGMGASDTATVTVTVNAVDDAPVARDDLFLIDEGKPFTTGNVLDDNGSGADSEYDGETLTVNTTPVSGPGNGVLVLASDGTFSYTPNDGFMGTDSFSYEVTDGNGGFSTATATIRIDNDRDGYTNDVDWDDDNDGILDVDECIAHDDAGSGPGAHDGHHHSLPIIDTLYGGVVDPIADAVLFDHDDYGIFVSGSGLIAGGNTDGRGFIDSGWYQATGGHYDEDLDFTGTSFSNGTVSVNSVTPLDLFGIGTRDATLGLTDTVTGSGDADADIVSGDSGNALAIETASSLLGPAITTVSIDFTDPVYSFGFDLNDLFDGGVLQGVLPTVTIEIDGDTVLRFVGADVLAGGGSLSAAVRDSDDSLVLGQNGLAQVVLVGNNTETFIGFTSPTPVSQIQINYGTTIASLTVDEIGLDNFRYSTHPVCDIDGDGIGNRLDLDSDGDGVYEVDEAGGTDNNNDGMVDGPVDENGVPIAANGGLDPAGGPSNPYDADSVPPIVIDMDGDGAEFNSIEDGILLDVDGDGELEKTAWANEDDAVLIFDGNENNSIDSPDEFAFARYSDDANATDLEGLRAGFDSDGDLVLSADDDEWEHFKLWQDSDGDGKIGEGELLTLDEAGIESIGLVNDGNAYSTAGGDVHVHGESTVNYADGTTGTAADAAFDYSELLDQSGGGSLEITTESGEVVNLDECDGCESLAAPASEDASIVVPEGAPAFAIDELAANEAAMQ